MPILPWDSILMPWWCWSLIALVMGVVAYWWSWTDVPYLGLAQKGTPEWRAMREGSVVLGVVMFFTWWFFVPVFVLMLVTAEKLKPAYWPVGLYADIPDRWEKWRLPALKSKALRVRSG